MTIFFVNFLKLTNPDWKRNKTLNEINCMKFVREILKINVVPKVYCFESEESKSEIGQEFILLEYFGNATQLNQIWGQWKTQQKKSLLQSLRNYVDRWRSLEFQQYGNFSNAKLFTCDLSSEMHQELLGTPTKFVSFEKRPHNLDVGPFELDQYNQFVLSNWKVHSQMLKERADKNYVVLENSLNLFEQKFLKNKERGIKQLGFFERGFFTL